MREMYNSLKAAIALAAATLSDDATGTAIDRLGFESLTFALSIGVGGITFTNSNKIEFVLEHSDDNSTYAAVAQKDVLGVTLATGGIVRALKTAHAAASMTRFGYIGDKRYVRLSADFGGTHGTGTPIAAVAILGHAHDRPVAA